MNARTTLRWFTPRRAILVGLLALSVLGILLWRSSRGTRRLEVQPPVASSPAYVGEKRCAPCHAEEVDAWRHSHHALAMQLVSDGTVLGDFKDARFSKDAVTSTFYKKDDKFYVRTDGPEGELQDYAIPYTFGVFPLQQYLVPFPNGRLQSLGIGWDSRPKESRRPAVVSSLSQPENASYRSTALDGAKPDVELHVCILSLYRPAHQLRSGKG